MANRDGQDPQPCMGAAWTTSHGNHPRGGHCAVLRIDGAIDAYATHALRDRVTDLGWSRAACTSSRTCRGGRVSWTRRHGRAAWAGRNRASHPRRSLPLVAAGTGPDPAITGDDRARWAFAGTCVPEAIARPALARGVNSEGISHRGMAACAAHTDAVGPKSCSPGNLIAGHPGLRAGPRLAAMS